MFYRSNKRRIVFQLICVDVMKINLEEKWSS